MSRLLQFRRIWLAVIFAVAWMAFRGLVNWLKGEAAFFGSHVAEAAVVSFFVFAVLSLVGSAVNRQQALRQIRQEDGEIEKDGEE